MQKTISNGAPWYQFEQRVIDAGGAKGYVYILAQGEFRDYATISHSSRDIFYLDRTHFFLRVM